MAHRPEQVEQSVMNPRSSRYHEVYARRQRDFRENLLLLQRLG
jgi:hypothetical protein